MSDVQPVRARLAARLLQEADDVTRYVGTDPAPPAPAVLGHACRAFVIAETTSRLLDEYAVPRRDNYVVCADYSQRAVRVLSGVLGPHLLHRRYRPAGRHRHAAAARRGRAQPGQRRGHRPHHRSAAHPRQRPGRDVDADGRRRQPPADDARRSPHRRRRRRHPVEPLRRRLRRLVERPAESPRPLHVIGDQPAKPIATASRHIDRPSRWTTRASTPASGRPAAAPARSSACCKRHADPDLL
ncbi:hypothetical protein J2S55_002945 [Streptosporangium brasiliense]|uniref:Uncharacterized protein n=1 Tax=Streptosporangium brasiliense TaxID=47480 RepID=A0ABT9R372_9ACTN|nr:hypothetical protein [Streptosporangium brasiliense]